MSNGSNKNVLPKNTKSLPSPESLVESGFNSKEGLTFNNELGVWEFVGTLEDYEKNKKGIPDLKYIGEYIEAEPETINPYIDYNKKNNPNLTFNVETNEWEEIKPIETKKDDGPKKDLS